MNKKLIAKAVFKAIAEDILLKLKYDTSTDTYVLPEGEIFSIDRELAHYAADELKISMDNNSLNEDSND